MARTSTKAKPRVYDDNLSEKGISSEEIRPVEPVGRFLVLVPSATMEDTGEKFVVFRESIPPVLEDPEECAKPMEDRKPKSFVGRGKTALWIMPEAKFDVNSEVVLTPENTGHKSDQVALDEYQHFKGGRYRVIGEAVMVGAPMITEVLANEEDAVADGSISPITGEATKVADTIATREPRYVIYRKVKTDEYWIRTVGNFIQKINTPLGNLPIPRFRRTPM